MNKLRNRRDALVQILNRLEGVEAHKPEAGFYIFPKITKLLRNTGFDSVEEFRKIVMRETGVSFCGRHHFGRPLINEKDDYIRLAFSGIGMDDLKEGMELFKNWIASNTNK